MAEESAILLLQQQLQKLPVYLLSMLPKHGNTRLLLFMLLW